MVQFGMLGLLGAWAALLFGGFIFGTTWPDRTRRMPAWTRMASSAVLVIAAWSWFLLAQGGESVRLAFFIAVGMSFGFLGDLIMAQILPFPDRVLGGIGAFGLGHIAYIIGLVEFGNRLGEGTSGARWGALLVWLLIGAIAWYFVVFRGSERSTLHAAALPYALLLAGTTGLATGLALEGATFLPLALGAALFLLSDLIDDVVWLTYGPGQMLIVFTLFLGA